MVKLNLDCRWRNEHDLNIFFHIVTCLSCPTHLKGIQEDFNSTKWSCNYWDHQYAEANQIWFWFWFWVRIDSLSWFYPTWTFRLVMMKCSSQCLKLECNFYEFYPAKGTCNFWSASCVPLLNDQEGVAGCRKMYVDTKLPYCTQGNYVSKE